MKLISAKLSTIPELKGKQIIVRQEAMPAVTASVVDETALDVALEKYRKKNPAVIQQVIQTCFTLAIKPVMENPSIAEAFQILQDNGVDLEGETEE